MSDRETQTALILDLLRKYGSVSAHDLTFRFGVTRTAARIWDLKQAGHAIRTVRGKRLEDGTQEMARYELGVWTSRTDPVIRRYAPMKPSSGTRIPDEVRRLVILRDEGCVGPRVGMPTDCVGGVELDHVRASGGIGVKSPSTAENLVSLCGTHHRLKTLEGRRWRPRLLAWITSTERA